MKILHVLHSAHPDVSGGSIRSRYLARAQAELGLEPIVLSSPFQPPAAPGNAQSVEWLDGIAYHRCFDPRYDHRFMVARKSPGVRARKLTAVLPFTRRVRRLARAERVALIHGHSLFYCGLAAALAARSLGLPSVYEVRSLIEDGLAEEGGTAAGGALYRAYRAFEWLAVHLATHVVVISDGLRADLVARGVAAERITVVRNGVDATSQHPATARDPSLLAADGFPGDAFVLGYVGTLLAYESLDLLLDAVAALAPEMPALRLLIVGDGPSREALERRSRERGLATRVRFTGRLPHEDVGRLYGSIDLFVLPRRPTRLTNLVTPLKPLEIMARAKPVLASDCGGHRELIIPGLNGFLYDARAPRGLEEALRDLANRRGELGALGAAARAWVTRERSWRTMVAPTVTLYERLVGPAAARRSLPRAANA